MIHQEKKLIVAMHQPNFLPWLGFFNKLANSDVFILMDTVQFPKSGGNWTNRHSLLISQRKQWSTIPIVRNYSGFRTVNEIEFADYGKWKFRYLCQLATNYARHPFYAEINIFLRSVLPDNSRFLSDFNIEVLDAIINALNLKSTRLVLLSDLSSDSTGTELLCDATSEVGGSTYLSGDGSVTYLQAEVFQRKGIQLEFQNFQHPEYTQYNQDNFVAGLSIVDALMNCGMEETRRLVLDV
jgi:hypothetical protein